MSKTPDEKEQQRVYNTLKYPGAQNWRDVDTAIEENGGYWPNGEPVRLNDPEMKPAMDAMLNEVKLNTNKGREFLIAAGLLKEKHD